MLAVWRLSLLRLLLSRGSVGTGCLSILWKKLHSLTDRLAGLWSAWAGRPPASPRPQGLRGRASVLPFSEVPAALKSNMKRASAPQRVSVQVSELPGTFQKHFSACSSVRLPLRWDLTWAAERKEGSGEGPGDGGRYVPWDTDSPPCSVRAAGRSVGRSADAGLPFPPAAPPRPVLRPRASGAGVPCASVTSDASSSLHTAFCHWAHIAPILWLSPHFLKMIFSKKMNTDRVQSVWRWS